MQTAGPYRLMRPLSSCEVGDVFAGVDADGRTVTVAVLNPRASADDRWRDAFAAAAEALGQAGADQLPITGADHDASRPWVACADGRGSGATEIFTVLGQRLEPVTEPIPMQRPPVPAAPPNGTAPPTGTVTPPPAEEATLHFAPVGTPIGAPSATPAAAARAATPAAPAAPPQAAPPQANPWAMPPDQSNDRTQLVPTVTPTSPPPAQPVAPPQAAPFQPSPAPYQSSGAPMTAAPMSGQPASGAPYPDPNLPAYPEGPFTPASVSSQPISGDLSYPNYPSRVFGDQPSPKPRRTGLLIAAVAVVCLLLGGAAGAGVMALTGGDDDEPGTSTTAAGPRPSAEELLLSPTPPAAPGVEPPVGGGWPTEWPTFTANEPTKPMNQLAGLGFDFRAPESWNCTQQQQTAAAVRYSCGSGTGAEPDSGGELTVRRCATPCTEAERTTLRTQTEAWGLKWIRSGPFTVFAETTQIDGQPRYGLVYVAFWRSVPEGEIDRQLVLRMTTAPETSGELKKVANSIRDKTFTL